MIECHIYFQYANCSWDVFDISFQIHKTARAMHKEQLLEMLLGSSYKLYDEKNNTVGLFAKITRTHILRGTSFHPVSLGSSRKKCNRLSF